MILSNIMKLHLLVLKIFEYQSTLDCMKGRYMIQLYSVVSEEI